MQFLKYTVIRLGLFLLVFLGLWKLMEWPIFTSGLIGLVVAFAITYLFLNKLRISANADVQKMFAKTNSVKTEKQLADEAAEDAFDEQQRKDGDQV